jgi:AraC-like DNA-binding protein
MVLQELGVSVFEHRSEKCSFEASQWTYWNVSEAESVRVHSHAEGTRLLVLEVPREHVTSGIGAASRGPLQILRYEDHPLLQTLRDFAAARSRFDAVWSARIGTLLSRVMECVVREQQRAQRAAISAHSYRLYRVRQYILERLHDPQLSFDAIAEHAGCSKRFVQMMFAEYGETVRHFILRNRLEQIHCNLSSSHDDITDIAVAYGFNDHSHFGRTYRRLFGVSPSNVRKAYRVLRVQRNS